LSFQKQKELSDAKDNLSSQEATNAKLQKQVDALAEAQKDQTKIEAIQAQVTKILQTDVSWAVMLQEIARTIPDDTWLTAFQGAVTSDAAATSAAANTAAGIAGSTATPGTATTPAPGALTGTVSFSATGLDFTSISSWITRVSDIPSYSNLWVPTASATQLGGRTVVNFTSNASLTNQARSDRLKQFQQGSKP
jgi:Tfp pilus assembly protein PilN